MTGQYNPRTGEDEPDIIVIEEVGITDLNGAGVNTVLYRLAKIQAAAEATLILAQKAATPPPKPKRCPTLLHRS